VNNTQYAGNDTIANWN